MTTIKDYKEKNDFLIDKLKAENIKLDAEFSTIVSRVKEETEHMLDLTRGFQEVLTPYNGMSKNMFDFLNCSFFKENVELMSNYAENYFGEISWKLGLYTELIGVALLAIVLFEVIIIQRYRKKRQIQIGEIDCELKNVA